MTMFVSLSLCSGKKDLGSHSLPLLKSQSLSLYLKAEPLFPCFTSLVPQRWHQFLTSMFENPCFSTSLLSLAVGRPHLFGW